jgi:hypothetical protein
MNKPKVDHIDTETREQGSICPFVHFSFSVEGLAGRYTLVNFILVI